MTNSEILEKSGPLDPRMFQHEQAVQPSPGMAQAVQPQAVQWGVFIHNFQHILRCFGPQKPMIFQKSQNLQKNYKKITPSFQNYQKFTQKLQKQYDLHRFAVQLVLKL